MFKINFRADFVSKDDRDTARIALHNQDVFWDGGFTGKLKCSHKTDDTSLGCSIEINEYPKE